MTAPQSNEIISRLLSDAGTTIPDSTEDTQVTSIASARVLSTRYKVYLLILLLVIYVFTMYIFLPSIDRHQAEQSSLQNIVTQLQSFESKRLQYMADANYMQKLQEQEEIFLNCVNNQTACDALDPVLQDRLDLSMMLIKLNNITDPVMGIDEKRILASLNDYALILNPNASGTRERNGAIQTIRISDPVIHDGNVSRVAIDMSIQFSNKDGLMSFINNIENTVANNEEYRLLYVIDQIDYDVVRYNEDQKANIQLSLFYYTP